MVITQSLQARRSVLNCALEYNYTASCLLIAETLFQVSNDCQCTHYVLYLNFPPPHFCSPVRRPPRVPRVRPRPRFRRLGAAQPDDRRAVPLAVPEDAQLDARLQERHLVQDPQVCSRWVSLRC